MRAIKILSGIATVTSVISFVLACDDRDFTEAVAWFIVMIYYTKDFIDNLINDK